MTGQCGTGFIIDALAQKSLMCFEPISGRMCKIRFKGQFRNVTVSAYAPTEDSLGDNKHAFYNQLHRECSKISKYDMLVILGGFNAQIGTEAFLKNVAGKFTLHTETNVNGEMLNEVAMTNSFIIKSTSFNHKRIHKGTWKIPGSEQTNQIDHILVSRGHGLSILDVKTARGPNCDSDYYLVKVKIKDRLATIDNNKSYKRKKRKVDNLKEPEQSQLYQKTLRTKLEALRTELTENENEQAIIEAAKETICEEGKNEK
jgi:hypothetical protein